MTPVDSIDDWREMPSGSCLQYCEDAFEPKCPGHFEAPTNSSLDRVQDDKNEN